VNSTGIAIAFGLVIIGLLGIGAGRLFSNRELVRKIDKLEVSIFKEIDRVGSELASIQQRCKETGVTCRSVRIEREHELQTCYKINTVRMEVIEKQLEKILKWMETNGVKI